VAYFFGGHQSDEFGRISSQIAV